MPRTSENQCRTCQAPDKTRDLIQKMRISGISLMDVSEFVTGKGYPLSHNAVARHELHWDREKAGALLSDGDVSLSDVTVKDVAKHKLKLYWAAHKDQIPNDTEIRAWMKLLAEIAQSETESEKMTYLRQMFAPQRLALPAPDIIEGEFNN